MSRSDLGKKICFVGNIRSIHLQRWIDYFLEIGYGVDVISQFGDKYRNIQTKSYKEILEEEKINRSLPDERIFAYRKYLNKIKPDLVHVHYIGHVFQQEVALSGFKPVFASVWGSDVNLHPKKDRLKLRKIRQALIKVDVVTATSRFLADNVKKLVGREVEIIPFGVDLGIFSTSKYEKNPSQNVKIGFFKGLKEVYGPEYLLKGFSRVLNTYSNTELYVVGEGALEEKVKDLARNLRLENKIHFIGLLRREEVPTLMSEMDITVMPSLYEGWGVSAVESQALGVPVVASNVGGIPEALKNGETGFLVPPKSPEKLSEALLKLIKSKRLRVKMGLAGRRFVKERFEWIKNAEDMKILYDKSIGEQEKVMNLSYDKKIAESYWSKRISVRPDISGVLNMGLPKYANDAFDNWFHAQLKKRIKKGDSILDVGCGIGRVLIPLAKGPYKVTGIDISTKMIELCSQEAKKQSVYRKIKLDIGSVDDLPYNKETFDVVILSEVLFHLPNQMLGKAIMEAERVLKKGGVVVATANNKDSVFLKDIPGLTKQRDDGYFFTIRNLDKLDKEFKKNHLVSVYRKGFSFTSILNSLKNGDSYFSKKYKNQMFKTPWLFTPFYKLFAFLDSNQNLSFLDFKLATLFFVAYRKK